MLKYTPQNQLSIFDFKAPFLAQLDIENRWVKMANIMPWEEMVTIYSLLSETLKRNLLATFLVL